jgi:hypothetical protein
MAVLAPPQILTAPPGMVTVGGDVAGFTGITLTQSSPPGGPILMAVPVSNPPPDYYNVQFQYAPNQEYRFTVTATDTSDNTVQSSFKDWMAPPM